jgi:hypothetical protein
VPKKDPIYTQTRQINYYCWTSWKELMSTLIYYELHKINCDALLYVFLRNTYLGVKVEQFLSKAKLNNDDVKLVCKFLRKFSKVVFNDIRAVSVIFNMLVQIVHTNS